MIRWIVSLPSRFQGWILSLALLLVAVPAQAGTWILDAQGGQHRTKFAWTIAGPGGTPNVLSELTFKSTGPKGTLNLRWLSESETFFVDTRFTYGLNDSGEVRDDDFALNDRQGLFSRSMSTIGGNSLYGVQGQLGWRFLNTEHIAIAFTAGYAFDYTSFRMTAPATQIVPAVPVDFSQLNSMYNARWNTVTIGLETQVPLHPLPLAFVLKGHYWPNVDYTGKGFWNLREGFQQNPSFRHQADGNGGDVDVSLLLRFTTRWQATAGYHKIWMKTRGGRDQTFFTDGSSPVIPFNGADYRASAWYAGIGYRW